MLLGKRPLTRYPSAPNLSTRRIIDHESAVAGGPNLSLAGFRARPRGMVSGVRARRAVCRVPSSSETDPLTTRYFGPPPPSEWRSACCRPEFRRFPCARRSPTLVFGLESKTFGDESSSTYDPRLQASTSRLEVTPSITVLPPAAWEILERRSWSWSRFAGLGSAGAAGARCRLWAWPAARPRALPVAPQGVRGQRSEACRARPSLSSSPGAAPRIHRAPLGGAEQRPGPSAIESPSLSLGGNPLVRPQHALGCIRHLSTPSRDVVVVGVAGHPLASTVAPTAVIVFAAIEAVGYTVGVVAWDTLAID